MGLLKYIEFISGSNFYSGTFQRDGNTLYYVGLDSSQNKVYKAYTTGLTSYESDNILGTANSFRGHDSGGVSLRTGGEWTGRYTRIFNNTYQDTYTLAGSYDDYLGYHSVDYKSYGIDGSYTLFIISDTNKSGIVSYEESFDHSSGGISYVKLEYKDKLDYSSTLSNPGTQLIANKLIIVNGYFIGGFVDVGLMSFSLSTSGIISQEDRISGGTNDYVQSVANYGNYLYFTTAGSSNSGSLRRTELTAGGTFSGTTTIVSTGTTAGAITINGDKLYYGSQMELHKYSINSSNGNLTHIQTYDLSTDHFTSAKIKDISIDNDTRFIVLETSEGRVLVSEEGDPITAGSKNRVIFMM